ncbi:MULTISPECIES: phage tail tape measure protein [unclassified Paraburkholderia]|uniref:phage tail tape measure protein n=1 Tax=unclassified Paraburkholderia TaxID=2615204 RepID=UPI00161C22D0|nr:MULTISPECIES: hypothetical protein [unclassified Paraburkholderia]MBB5447073.1 hypothetical protein [Paraburkholderia sp. WSM4177]MBB5487614.1 hypothetical protein [Paraburkholderia sp. WSM4180]
MNQDLKLRVVFDMVDRAARPLKNVMAGSKGLSRAIAETRKELAGLQKQQKTVNAVRALRTEMGQTASKLKEAQGNLAGLREKLNATSEPTKRLQNEFRRASNSVVTLTQKQEQQRNRLGELNSRMQEAGRGTRTLANHENALRTSIERTSTALGKQSKRMQTMQAASERLGKRQALASNMAVAGYAARATGGRMVGGIGSALDQAKAYEQQLSQFRALGVSNKELSGAVGFADRMDVKGVSKLDRLKLLKETYTITRDMHHAEEMAPLLAKMKVGIETVMAGRGHGEGHGEQAEQMLMDLVKTTELRGSLKSPAAFKQAVDNATKAYVASGGTVKPEDFLNAIKTGGVAAKQLGDNAFYFGLLHTMQEMGGFRAGTGLMSAYTNWAQGRTTQQSGEDLVKMGLIDEKSVKYGKTGHVTKIMGDALKQVDLYKTDPFEYLMKVVIPKINPTGKLNDQQVIGKISQLFSSRKGGDLFSSLYLERANILKHRESAPKAFGVDALYREGMGTAYGGEMDALAKKATLEKELGEKILPMYNRALGLTASLIDRVTGFTERHQTVTKALVVGLAGLGLLIGAGGTITLGLASMIGPLALTHYGIEMLGAKGSVTARMLDVMGGGFKAFGSAVFTAGRALLMSPITWIVLGIAAAVALTAYLIYRYWEPISAFFRSRWAQIKEAFGGGIEGVTRLVLDWSPLGAFYTVFRAVMSWFGVELPAKFSDFGLNMMAGLVNGMTTGLATVKQAVMNVADSTVSWFKEKLGIHSPSRVFGLLGGFIGQGAAIGIEGERPRVAGAVARLAGTAVNAFGAGAALFASDKPMFDRRGPIAAAPIPAGGGATTYTIHFNFPAGASMPDSSALATLETRFRNLLEQHERDKARRAGSSFSDRG